MSVQELIDRFEAFKLKGLRLNEQDLFDRITLNDEMNDKAIELESEFLENDLEFDRDYGKKLIELKEMKDKDGKKVFTDSTAKAFCDNEFYERKKALIEAKQQFKLLNKKASLIIEYINAVKLAIKKDFSI